MKLRAVEFDGSNHRRVLTETNVNIGMFYLDVDGYYYYEPLDGGGYFGAHTLRDIANLLDEINAPYDKQVKEYFKELEIKCGDNVTTCIYFNNGVCENQPDECRSQTSGYEEPDFLVDEFTGIPYPKKESND